MNGGHKAFLVLLIGEHALIATALLLMQIDWMAWTLPTGMFFFLLAHTLLVMAACECAWPTVERTGWLRFRTPRGDRFFLGILGTAALLLPAAYVYGESEAFWDLIPAVADCFVEVTYDEDGAVSWIDYPDPLWWFVPAWSLATGWFALVLWKG